MSPFALLDHLIGFIAPALCVALGVTLAGRWVLRRRGLAWRRALVHAGIGVLVLLAGLVVFGRDGKMATYAALVVAIATSEWLLERRWRT